MIHPLLDAGELAPSDPVDVPRAFGADGAVEPIVGDDDDDFIVELAPPDPEPCTDWLVGGACTVDDAGAGRVETTPVVETVNCSGGDEGGPAPDALCADDGGPDPTTPGADDGGPDPTTPGADDGGPDPTTPGADDGGPDPTTPGADDGGPDPTTPGADADGFSDRPSVVGEAGIALVEAGVTLDLTLTQAVELIVPVAVLLAGDGGGLAGGALGGTG